MDCPTRPTPHGERQARVEDRGERVHEGHVGDDAGEELRREVRHRADEQAAGAAAHGDQPLRLRAAGIDEMSCDVDEVGEGVPLLQLLAVVVPGAAHLAAAAHVRHDEDHAPVHEREPGDGEPGIEGGLVGAVAVQQGGRGPVADVLAAHHGHRYLRAVTGGHPEALGRVQRGVVARDVGPLEHRLLPVAGSSSRTVPGVTKDS